MLVLKNRRSGHVPRVPLLESWQMSEQLVAFLFPPRCLTVFQFVPLYSLTLRINLMISDYFVQPSGTVKHQEQLEVYSRERTSPMTTKQPQHDDSRCVGWDGRHCRTLLLTQMGYHAKFGRSRCHIGLVWAYIRRGVKNLPAAVPLGPCSNSNHSILVPYPVDLERFIHTFF